MLVVKRILSSSHIASLKVLEAVSSVAGVETFKASTAKASKTTTTDGTPYAIEMSVSVHNAFSTSETSYTVKGLTACVRALAQAVPESGLWGQMGASGETIASIESWIETASTALIDAAYVTVDDKVKDSASQIEEFAASVEKQLASSAFLVGASVTAADIVVAILLATAATRAGVGISGSKTSALLETILTNSVVSKVTGEYKAPTAAVAAPAPAAAVEATATSGSEDFSSNTVVQKLDALSIPHTTYSHTLSMKVEELLANVPLPAGETHTKNVFFKDKKHGMFLLSVMPDADVNTKWLGKALELKGKTNLRLASEDLLMSSLGVKTGCVGPLSIMNNEAKDVTLVLDEALFAAGVSKIHSHPLTNDASTALVPADLKKFFEGVGVEPVILEFGKKGEGPPAGKAPANRAPDKKEPKGTQKGGQSKNKDKKTSKKGETLLALQWKKSENFAMWYSDVIVLSEMISYYDISGCYILRPWSYTIWDLIQNWFNIEIGKLGVENSYFPLFVSQDRLEKEKDHVEGFAPEVAWVTRSGDGELAKPIAVRPTSETIMYPAFSDWIKSHRDLPLKLNQWSNVVRWEFKDPTPFLRSREFLWQEGHTAHATYEDSQVMVRQALELYRRVYEELYAVPVVPGYKTEEEKFAGGHQTTTVEAYIAGSGRAIQGATSHNLGQNFGKMFDIKFQDETGKSQIVWQTSWGLTTRSIGVMVMVHGDDKGLVLPPRVAPLQAVIVPIVSKKLTYADAKPYCEGILKDLHDAGIRAKFDDRDMYNPGWKYNHWEQKGVPVRIEVGPRDVETKQVRIVSRYNGEKEDISIEGIGVEMVKKLDTIQNAMFEKAKEARDEHLVKVTEWKDFVPNLELSNLVLTPWCGGEHKDWEEWVKDKSREESLASRGQEAEDERCATSVAAKTLCIPFDQPELPEGTKCFASGLPATCWVMWGRSY